MAPRTRSNRAEKLAVQKLLSSGIPVNTRGFPALPNELYWEILSHLPALQSPQDVEKMDPYRQLTLYYLSQTCQSLRRFFLRYAWERIEVFGGMWTPRGRLATKAERNKRGLDMKHLGDKKQIAEILRQLETVVVRNPNLRQYVSFASLSILEASINSVLPKIARNLTFFPNLHTLQLIFQFHCREQVFSEFRYSNVHTLNLSHTCPHDILHACPNTRNLSFYKDEGFRIRQLFHKDCANTIETLGVLNGLRHRLHDMVKFLPRLSDLSLGSRILRESGEYLECLSALPLHTIRLRLDYRSLPIFRHVTVTPAERQRWIDLAKGILANCSQHEAAKELIVVNSDKTVEVYRVRTSP